MHENKNEDLQAITDDLEVHDILRGIVRNKEKLWAWQKNGDKRIVCHCFIRKVDVIKKFCEIIPIKSNQFKFNEENDIFIHSKERRLAIKVNNIIEFDSMFIRFTLPSTINQVEEDFLDKIELVEKENEHENIHKRYTKRKKIKDEKLTGLYKQVDEEGILGFYVIGDVSSGGMSFFVDDPSEFENGQELNLISVGERDFKKPVAAIVRSIRQVEDEYEETRFKVGIQFLKG